MSWKKKTFSHSSDCVCVYVWGGDWSVCLSYLHFIISEANDAQGFPHYLPVIAVIYGAHFGTVTLKK